MNLEAVQVVIIVSLSISTILITIIGLQILFLLRDVHKIVKRVNGITSGFSRIFSVMEHSFGEVDSIANGARLLLRLVGKVMGASKKKKHG